MLKAAYEFLSDDGNDWGFLKKGKVTASFHRMQVDYEEFSDIRSVAPVGSEPLYQLDASIYQVFFTFWY